MQMFLRCLVLEPLLVSRHRSLTLEYGDRDSEIEKLKDCFDFIFPSSSAPVFVPLHPTALLSPLSATLLPLSLSPSPLGEGVESLERAKLSPSGSRLSLPHPTLAIGQGIVTPTPTLAIGQGIVTPHTHSCHWAGHCHSHTHSCHWAGHCHSHTHSCHWAGHCHSHTHSCHWAGHFHLRARHQSYSLTHPMTC